ncbi:class I SAM-dependent methyltransferase [Pseudomonas sp. R37(2017)]|uniref:class I SAM-dependent methyltransferase n=1 Tax=Pseudomonas sp. R37(2017) TaxID=1981685 RepID=UPI000A1FC76F|nr:class I SAM-dependent methyltransferase [Pseudomonas sp. R37(2017)]
MHDETVRKNEYSEQNRKMADLYFRNNKYKEASRLYELSIKINQNNVKALNNLAVLSEELGDNKKAEQLYKQACGISETLAADKLKYLQNLASIQEKNGNLNAALWTYQSAVKIEGFTKSRIAFNYLYLLSSTHLTSFDPITFSSLAILFNVEEIDTDALAQVYLSQLALKLEKSKHPKNKNTIFALNLIETEQIALTILSNNLITNHVIEEVILDIRKNLMTSMLSGCYTKTHTDFLIALKKQCTLNGFIYPVDSEELSGVEKLKEKILELPTDVRFDAQLIISSYSAIDVIEKSNNVLPEYSTHKFGSKATPITDSLRNKQLIRAFYESNPYPAWTSKPKSTPSTLDQLFRNLNLNSPPSEKNRILVAGCGTGRHAIQLALTYPHADVIGLDISLVSLEYAARKRDEYKIRNLKFIHGDLNDISSFGMNYSLIECIGVLHHLQDPLKGCRAILSALCQGGIAKLGLYSTSARAPITELASLAAEKRIPYVHSNLEKIRKLAIENYNQGRVSEIVNSRDFFSRSGCMDLLFNPAEKTFNANEINELVQTLNCEFAGFEKGGQAGSPTFRDFGNHSDIEKFFNAWKRFESSSPAFFSEMYLFWLKP